MAGNGRLKNGRFAKGNNFAKGHGASPGNQNAKGHGAPATGLVVSISQCPGIHHATRIQALSLARLGCFLCGNAL